MFFTASIGMSLFFIIAVYVFLSLWYISKNFIKNYLYMTNDMRNSLYVFVDKVNLKEKELLEIKEISAKGIAEVVYGSDFVYENKNLKLFFVDMDFFKNEFMINGFERFDCLVSDGFFKDEKFISFIKGFFKGKSLFISCKKLNNHIYGKSIFLKKEFQNDFLLPIKPQFIRVILKNQTEIKKIKVDIINYFISKYNRRVLVYNPNEHIKKLIFGFIKLIIFLIILGFFYFTFLSLFLFEFISDILRISIKKYLCYNLIGFPKTYIFISMFLGYFLIFIISFLFSSYILKNMFLDLYMFILSLVISFLFLVSIFVFIYKREYVSGKISC